MDQAVFEKLPLKERIIVTASGKLIKHFKGLEAANLLNEEETSSFIGCVKKLSSVAMGEEIKDQK